MFVLWVPLLQVGGIGGVGGTGVGWVWGLFVFFGCEVRFFCSFVLGFWGLVFFFFGVFFIF